MLAARGLLHAEFQGKCPCCRQQNTPETMEHAMLFCPRWEGLRSQFFDAVVEDLATLLDDLRGQDGIGDDGDGTDVRREDFFQLAGLLGGQPGMGSMDFRGRMEPQDIALGFFRPPQVSDLSASQDRVMESMLCFLQALTYQRGPIISALISTESQRRTGRARRPREQPSLPWVDIT